MMFRKRNLLAWLSGAALSVTAAVPPAEQLLPADTLAVFSVPDWGKVAQARKQAPLLQLWDDPALRPFREKFLTKLSKEVIEPMEAQLGIKLADYAELLQGQFALAVTQNGWKGTKDPLPGLILLLDTKDKADSLRKNLAEVKKKLTDAGKKIKTEKVREVEFTVLVLDLDELAGGLEKAMPGAEKRTPDEKPDQPEEKKESEKKPGQKLEVSFGQVDSLLVVGTVQKDLEKVLARLGGGSAPNLAEQGAFETDQRALFREALSFGWVNVVPLSDALGKLAQDEGKETSPNPMAPKPEKILSALGLASLKTAAMSARQGNEGSFVEFYLGVPEDKNRGLLKLLVTESKEANPPAFVPADAVQYTRWRADGQKFWATLESIVNEITPGMLGFMLGQLESALKEKDPNFNIQRNLVGNLGNDVITYQKAPRGVSFEELNSPPSIFLLGSPNAEPLLQTVKAMMVMLPGPMGSGEFKEREFLGRKIYSIGLPSFTPPGAEKAKERSLHLSASGGYVAMSTDALMIEEYLRSSDSKPKPLQDIVGLAEAAQKVGGTATGLFGYQNDLENMRALFEAIRANPDLLAKSFALTPFAGNASGGDKAKALKDWLDFSLLPPFDKMAKYFYMTVYAGKMSANGFSLKVHSPAPPQVKP